MYKIQVTVCVTQYLLSSVAFGKLLFVFLLFFYRPLSCLSFLELPLWYLKIFLCRILTAQVQQSDACFQYLFCQMQYCENRSKKMLSNTNLTNYGYDSVRCWRCSYFQQLQVRHPYCTKSRTAVFYMPLFGIQVNYGR